MKKIISIFDNNPWYAAFIYPIAYLIFAIVVWFLMISLHSNSLSTNKIIDMLLLITFINIFLPPIWVIIGLIISKKKLPYLLSLIIGLGIPISLILWHQGIISSI